MRYIVNIDNFHFAFIFSPPNGSLDGVLLYRCGGSGGGGGVGGGRFLEMALPVVL